MKEHDGVNHRINSGLFLIALAVFFVKLPVLGWMKERKEYEKSRQEEKNQLLVLPLAYYTPETKIAAGVGGIYYLRSLRDQAKGHPSTFFMDVIATQEKQFIAEITPELYLGKGKIHLTGYLGFKKYVEKFYGVGSGTTKGMEENFSYRSFRISSSLRRRIGPNFYVGLQYDFEYTELSKLKPGGLLDSSNILGKDGGTFSGVGIILVQDSRDNKFFPAKGILLQTRTMLFSPALASDYRFQQLTFDFRQYITLFPKHVLAFRQNFDATAGNVPFQRLPKLGGPNVLRGYMQGRFRDKKAVFLQMEYRIPLIWRLSAAGFVGCGSVADRLKSFRLDGFKISGGLGIRFQVNRKSGTNVRLDFGFAEGNLGVYAMINEAF